MRALITGGAGFIGSHLAERLLADGHDVAILDDLSTGQLENVPEGAEFYEGDVADQDIAREVRELVVHCNVVFHLAAAVGVKLIVEEPVRTLTTNIRGTENILRAAAIYQRPVVLASSSEVYGQRDDPVPLHEDAARTYGPTTQPRWAYAESKALDEFMALAYTTEYGLDARIARIFNTVGPRQSGRYGMVVPRFAVQAVTGGDIEIFGDGKQTRCFCHVSDTVDALIRLAQVPRPMICNIGNPQNHIAINDLAETVRGLAGSDSPIVHVRYEDAYGVGIADMRHRRPNIDKAYTELGWEPKVPLDEILKEAVQAAKTELEVAR